jgi:hypothetical protein
MKLTTITVNAIEMTLEEENRLWVLPGNERCVCGKRVLMWHTSDGRNEMLLEGETILRPIIYRS